MTKINKEELESVSMNTLEQAILVGDYSNAEKILVVIMTNQRKGKMEFKLAPADRVLTVEQNNIEGFQLIEKMATLLTKMLSDINYIASAQMFKEFILGKRFLTYTFMASSYQNMDHIIRNLGLNKKSGYSREDIRRFLILISPNSTYELPWQMLAKHMPMEVGQAYLGMVTTLKLLFEKQACTNMNKLVALSKDLPLMGYKYPEDLVFMATAYFAVSNLVGDEKYELKKWITRNYQKFMEQYLSNELKNKIKTKIAKKPKESKQTILIIHEHYRLGHAMHRCYHGLISCLSSKYHVVAMGEKGKVDELGKQDSAEFIEFEDPNDIKSIIEKVIAVAPDVIYYPSLGMSNFAALLATQRLAPVQCMSPGHPSSSYFENIDYMLIEDMGLNEAELTSIITEKPIVIPTKKLTLLAKPFDNYSKEPSNSCNILVNGVVQKVTSELIKVCDSISKKAKGKVVFHFFMASTMQDLEYFSAISLLRRFLPNSMMHPFGEYNTYMETIAKCDFALPSIPFGSANSNVDIARLGIPKLFLNDKRDLSGVTDYYIWKELGDISGLCSDTEELINRAVSFVDDKEVLQQACKRVREVDIDSFIVSNGSERSDDRLLKSMELIIADKASD